MGTLISAICKCGYEKKKMRLGGGMSNFQTTCDYPFYCKGCSSIIVLNLQDNNRTCPDCGSTSVVSYEDSIMYERKSKISVFRQRKSPALGREVVLLETEYICPACNEYGLRFSWAGNWD